MDTTYLIMETPEFPTHTTYLNMETLTCTLSMIQFTSSWILLNHGKKLGSQLKHGFATWLHFFFIMDTTTCTCKQMIS